MYLNDCFFFRPEKMVRFRLLHDGDASSRQWFGFCRIELLTDADINRARNHGYVLNSRVPVSRDLVVSREP